MLVRLVPATGKRNNTVPIMIVIEPDHQQAFCLALAEWRAPAVLLDRRKLRTPRRYAGVVCDGTPR